MFGLLPDLTPRDSHSIWYTSSRNPVTQAALLEAHEQRENNNNNNNHGGPSQQQQQQHSSSSRRAGHLLIERSALARLRVDEQQMDRRRLHVQNFGSTWLKPPGVPKSLHQIREELREQQEHAEAMRREQLAQELADAEAAGQDGLEDIVEGEEGEEPRDLDDEIPDAEESFGFDGGEDSMADELSSSEGGILDNGGGGGSNSSDDDQDDDDDDDDDDATAVDEDEGERRDVLVAARMRMADDAFRQAMARGDVDGDDMYGAEEELEASGQGDMLDEEDLLAPGQGVGADDDLGMDMDADLDDEIPEARDLSGVYEHTDSEAESSMVSSSDARGATDEEEEDDDDDVGDISFAPRAAPLRAPLSPTGDRGRGLRFAAAPRSSLDLSGLLSADGSSMMDSSPNVRAYRR